MENQRRRTEEDWCRLHENAAVSTMAALCANSNYENWSHQSLASEAVWCADALVDELRKREEKEIKQITSEEQ